MYIFKIAYQLEEISHIKKNRKPVRYNIEINYYINTGIFKLSEIKVDPIFQSL
jgi:hypothetical protein